MCVNINHISCTLQTVVVLNSTKPVSAHESVQLTLSLKIKKKPPDNVKW